MTTMTVEKEVIELEKAVEEQMKTYLVAEIKTDVLRKLVSSVDRATARTTTIPVMQGIYLSINSERLLLRATNSNYSVEVVEPYDEKEKNFTVKEGTEANIVVMDKRFSSMLSSLPKKLKVTIEGKIMTLSAGRSKFRLSVLEGDEFPNFPNLESAQSFSIHPNVLLNLYDKTIYAASTSETRPALTGIHHAIKNKTFRLEATDAIRLANVEIENDSEVNVDQIIVPASTITEVMKHLKDAESLTIYFSENHLIYDLKNTKIYTRLIGHQYPDIHRLIPASYQAEVKVKAEDLAETLKRACIVNQEEAVWIKVLPTEKQMRVQSLKEGDSFIMEDILLLEGSGQPIQLALNPKLLKEAVDRYVKASTIRLQFTHTHRPLVIRPANDDLHYVSLILPVRASEVDPNAPVIIENFQAVKQESMNVDEE
jgi:DNA polymerase III subunit beta